MNDGHKPPLDSIPRTGHNVCIIISARCIASLVFIFALLFTTAGGWCAERNASIDFDQQIAERIRQYHESLRQRAAQLSPSLQANIEAQAQQTVAKGLERWENGEVDIQIALPDWTETYRMAQFFAKHLPFSGSPAGSLAFGNSVLNAALTVTTVRYILKAWVIPVADSATACASLYLFRQNSDVLSYFVGIVCTIVQRR